MPFHKSPGTIASELLSCGGEKREATNRDLIKVLGNETQFTIWIEEFVLCEEVLVERREGSRYCYRKTERGRLFHRLLTDGNLIDLFSGVGGNRL